MNTKKIFASIIVISLIIPLFTNYDLISAEEIPEYIDDKTIEGDQ